VRRAVVMAPLADTAAVVMAPLADTAAVVMAFTYGYRGGP
jgi:hypothetical protein